MEVGDSQLNFLELTIIIRNGFMIFDWYQKPTFSGRIFNYFSPHSITQKRGIIMNLIDKVFSLYPDFQQKNFSLIINFLLDNSYSLDFIFSCIGKRLAIKFHGKNQPNTSVNSYYNDYFVIPYVKRASERFMQFFKNISNIKLSFFDMNKLSSIIKVQKDPLPPLLIRM